MQVYSEADTRFRAEVRAFIAEALPAEMARKARSGVALNREDYFGWQRILAEQGWLTPTWPAEHGGCGWTPIQQHIFEVESHLAGAPRIIPFGIKMVGPVIIHFGNEAQKAAYLPGIREATTWWCQGFSEPGAGSDLASLRTRAERDGDHYVINGQKTWTTYAQYADMIFFLARTKPDAPRKQEGISFFVARMDTPGITVRPITTLDGGHEINETFFEDVRIPAENLIGEENKGWSYAKFLLSNERAGIARVGEVRELIRDLHDMTESQPVGNGSLLDDPAFLRRVTSAEIDALAHEVTTLRLLSREQESGRPNPLTSVLKIRGSEVLGRLAELQMEVEGPLAACFRPSPAGDPELPQALLRPALKTGRYLNYRKFGIFGGTTEIQKNILAKTVLDLKG
ncbi:MAG: acyl-CoA dehydrogenase family protein [Ectothiorhodospiraceae bacterium]|nr:acyl-CoA dehydrogenase family protein [Ectothiorhodospiraceae bacterium]MCH8506602.1 acyl-CoA dehydrogenase family protein [Ectothiorhodospiraceae bacterium]